jgi:hypothetical protein
MLLNRHSGLGPEASALATGSKVGCRIKSGMTVRKKAIF